MKIGGGVKESKFVPNPKVEVKVDRIVDRIGIRKGSKLEDLMRPTIRAALKGGKYFPKHTEEQAVALYARDPGFQRTRKLPEYK